MNISVNTAANAAVPNPAAAGVNAGAAGVPGVAANAPAGAGTPAPLQALLPQYAALPSGLPLFAQALGIAMNDAPAAGTDTAEPAKTAEPGDGLPADIAQAGTAPDAGLAAMAPPLMPLPGTVAAAAPAAVPTDADADAGAQRLAVVTAQQIGAQQNPALAISRHPDAVTLNAPAATPAPGRDAREPLAAAFPAPSADAGGGKAAAVTALPATSPAAMLAPAAGRDAERVAAPVAPASGALGLASVAANGATAAPSADTIKLSGPAQQWQEPLREALGERLQTQIGRNSEQATIRLEPPMLGRIDISIRHSAGMLQVNVTASNPEVLRQLQGIGENMRSDLAQRQYTEVAVNIGATPRSPAAQAFAEGDARGQRQPGRQNDDAEPGRALSDGSPAGTTYAMHEREMT